MTPNKFNTAPDGTTVIDVNTVLNEPTTLILDSRTTPYIDAIISLNPTKTTFIFRPGTYRLSNLLTIRKNGVRLVGMTGVARDVQIIQTMNKDGVSIRANSVLLQDLYIKCNFPGKVCLTGASANNTVVSGCYIYGAPDTFSVFFAGPSDLLEGSSTLDAYNRFYLDTGNRMYNNVFYSNFSGDSVSFSLQYKSFFVNNFIRGGKLAVYMCRTCNIFNNIVSDSTSEGIFVSFPSDRLSIVGNKIRNSSYSGIVMRDQLEHGAFTRYDYNIFIRNNTVFGSKSYGIELNNARNISITNNNIVSNQTMGIYSYNGTKLTIKNNKIAYFRYGVFLENNTDTKVEDNNIMSMFPSLGDNAVKTTSTSNTTNIANNQLRGEYRYDLIADSGPNNTVGSNPISALYTIDEERRIYTVS